MPPRHLRSCPKIALFEPHSCTPGAPVTPDVCVSVAAAQVVGYQAAVTESLVGAHLCHTAAVSLVAAACVNTASLSPRGAKGSLWSIIW